MSLGCYHTSVKDEQCVRFLQWANGERYIVAGEDAGVTELVAEIARSIPTTSTDKHPRSSRCFLQHGRDFGLEELHEPARIIGQALVGAHAYDDRSGVAQDTDA